MSLEIEPERPDWDGLDQTTGAQVKSGSLEEEQRRYFWSETTMKVVVLRESGKVGWM